MYSNTEMLELLIERVSQRQPTSVIRKGDGENLVLGYGVLPDVSRKWYFKKLYHFNVYPWQIAFQLFLRTELIRTYQNADFLGISLPEHRHGHWSLEEDILRLFGLEQIPSFDMNFHMALIKYPNEYRLVTPVAEKLVSGKRIGLITHRDLTEFFNHFESEVVVRLEIPKRRSRVHVMNR